MQHIRSKIGLPLILLRSGYKAAFLDRQLVLQVLYNHIQQKQNVLLGKRLQSIEHREDVAVVHCVDGSVYKGDVIVGADGVFSTTRQEMWRLADALEPGYIPQSERDGTCYTLFPCLLHFESANLSPFAYSV